MACSMLDESFPQGPCAMVVEATGQAAKTFGWNWGSEIVMARVLVEVSPPGVESEDGLL